MSWELMSYGELISGGTNVLDSSVDGPLWASFHTAFSMEHNSCEKHLKIRGVQRRQMQPEQSQAGAQMTFQLKFKRSSKISCLYTSYQLHQKYDPVEPIIQKWVVTDPLPLTRARVCLLQLENRVMQPVLRISQYLSKSFQVDSMTCCSSSNWKSPHWRSR